MGARSRALFGLAGAAYVIFAACAGPAVPMKPAPDAGADASAPDVSTFGSGECAGCLNATCASALQACAGDPECAAHLQCLFACPVEPEGGLPESCASSCPAPAGATGDAAKRALETCATACPACGATEVECAHPLLCQTCYPTSFPNDCGKCWFEKCCETFHPCNDQPECVAIENCFGDCPGTISDCFAYCFAQYPKYVDIYLEDHACFTHFCGEACDIPSTLDEKCQSCIDGPCVANRLECEIDPGCFLLSLCIGECGFDSPCVEACHAAADPHALELFEAYHLCKALKCNGACQL
jgi:hypothetical protein